MKDMLIASGLFLLLLLSAVSASGQASVGCISETLLVGEQEPFVVTFEDNRTAISDPLLCPSTCLLAHPDTTLAFLSSSETESICRCALNLRADFNSRLGPDLFCSQSCGNGSYCGGKHTFADGVQEVYYSLYSVKEGILNRIVTDEDVEKMADMEAVELNHREVEKLLGDIWYVLVKTNVASIVLIGLMVMLLILVITLLVWAFLFMEDLEKGNQSLFYRKLSGAKRPINGNPPTYGSTSGDNPAFDPNSEPGLNGVEVDLGGASIGNSTFLPTTETHDDEESAGNGIEAEKRKT